VLLICGSVAQPSHTEALLGLLAQALAAHSLQPVVWNLRELPLPVADPALHERSHVHPDAAVRRLDRLATAAAGFALASPVYHNSYTGVLKNALDNLGIRQFEGKPVALLSHGSPRTCVQACDHLRIVVRGLYGIAVPTQIATVDADFRPEQVGYRVTNAAVAGRVSQLAGELAFFIERLSGQPLADPARDGGGAWPRSAVR